MSPFYSFKENMLKTNVPLSCVTAILLEMEVTQKAVECVFVLKGNWLVQVENGLGASNEPDYLLTLFFFLPVLEDTFF